MHCGLVLLHNNHGSVVAGQFSGTQLPKWDFATDPVPTNVRCASIATFQGMGPKWRDVPKH
jgi:hypothetical protein